MALEADRAAGLPAPGVAALSGERQRGVLNRISWGAVFAGVVAALVVQMLINMLGIGIGLASVQAGNTGDNPDAGTLSIGAAIWFTLSGIIASYAGGAVAGRLCGGGTESTARWHGLVTWCTATLVVLYLLGSAIGSVVGGSFNAIGSAASGAGRSAASAVSGAAGMAQNSDTSGLEARARSLVSNNDANTAQQNILDYLRASVSGDQQQADASRDRAADSLAKAANVSPDEAKARLDQARQQAQRVADQARQKAQAAADAARRTTARAAFFGFVALVLGAIAAWFGGSFGARRRTVA